MQYAIKYCVIYPEYLNRDVSLEFLQSYELFANNNSEHICKLQKLVYSKQQ